MINRTQNTVWAGACAALIVLGLGSHAQAKAVECKGKDDCKAKITAAMKDGAVCFSTSWVPKPEAGWPDVCRTRFTCADREIYGRAYFAPTGEIADWVDDPTNNTKELRNVAGRFVRGGSFLSGTSYYDINYSEWALSPKSRNLTSQGEAFRGKGPGGTHYFDNKTMHESSPEYYCTEGQAKGHDYGWYFFAQKRVFTGQFVTKVVDGRVITEKESEVQKRIYAEGIFHLTK